MLGKWKMVRISREAHSKLKILVDLGRGKTGIRSMTGLLEYWIDREFGQLGAVGQGELERLTALRNGE